LVAEVKFRENQSTKSILDTVANFENREDHVQRNGHLLEGVNRSQQGLARKQKPELLNIKELNEFC
jgi:hypothetical protein